MKRVFLAALAVSLLAAGAALAAPPAQAKAEAVKACNAARTSMGVAVFKQTYGTNANKSNAFGKCVAQMTRTVVVAQASAAKDCRAEQADSNFAASHGGKTFAQYYGTGPRLKNAFGKCVAMKAKTQTTQVLSTHVNAAKACKAERTSIGVTAFKNKYGTNANKSNAFGKCVAKMVKASS